MILYFAKINLLSHIFDVYKDEKSMQEVLNTVMSTMTDESAYEKEIVYKNGADVDVEKIIYKIHIVDKTQEYIYGYVYKDSKIRYKVFDHSSKEMKPKVVTSNEAVSFYFDVYNEKIGYNTANRFGYREFLEAFEGILNECLLKDDNKYKFSVNLCTEGLTIEQIENDLKQISGIQKLKFKFQPPNPDSKELNSIQKDMEEKLKDFEEANIGTKSVIFTASKVIGLNIHSKEVKEQLEEANNIHSEIDASSALKNGYVEIEATDSHGNRHITGNEKPVKKEISKVTDFIDACRNVIRHRNFRKE